MKKEVLMYKFTFKNGDELELKGIKHAEFASQETHCYEASVYFNGKIIGWVNNDGFGGSDTFNPKEPFRENNNIWARMEHRIAEDHPQYHLEWDDSMNDMTMEVWCGEQVNKWLAHRDFKKYMKSKVVFTDPTSDDPKAIRYFSFKGVRSITKQHIDHIITKYPNYNVLNVMPQEEALALWMAN